ncbi:MAG TPA: molybdopterin-dependent oxidoreductase [Chthoniobacteraceae bacterium]|jgi:assimilatory nitrate reductase catalytic subunit|nr:molybdopterin-dependent oxidoreductase [Chthoniobacteraceae bacterium]
MSPQTQEVPAGEAHGSPRAVKWRRFHAPARRGSAVEAAGPLLRASRDAAPEPCEWGAALAAFCRGFRRIRQAHGGRSATWAVSPNLTNEELAFCASLASEGLGFTPGESGCAPALSPAWEAPEESDVIIAFGDITAAQSPLWQRLSCNRHQPRVIAIATGAPECPDAETARYAPRPGSGLTLLYGLANIIIAGGWLDDDFIRARTAGFEAYAERVAHYTTDRVAAETGLEAEHVWDLAQSIGTGARVSFCGQPDPWPQTEPALRNLALLTGQWARPGTGLCVDLEPANALGAALFAGTGTPAHGEAAARTGKLKGLWLIASDAAWSPEEIERWSKLAARLEFFVVQGGESTPLAPMADLFLPTRDWRAKEGTRLDPRGRLRLLKPRPQPPGCAMTDFRLFQLLAQYWGCGAAFSRWSSPETAFQILKQSTRGGPHDFSAVADYAAIDAYRPAPEAVAADAARIPFLF